MNMIKREETKRPVKVLQFGEGNFLRAFADWMIDIANSKGVTDMGVAVVTPRFCENAMVATLTAQDSLYHVVLEGLVDGKPQRSIRLVTCLDSVFSPLAKPQQYEEVVCAPSLRFVVSNTTEAGICYAPDDVLSDTPATFPGKITALLYKRYIYFGGDPAKGLIFLPCELIENNGTLLRRYVLRHAAEAALPQAFISWVEEACIFCDTLVDRIVSGFPKDNIDAIQAEIGCDDNAVVVGEPYSLWVIGGKDSEKVKAELPLHLAGLNVKFVPDVAPYRTAKVRILNGSHTAMVPLGLMLGHETVGEAMADPRIAGFLSAMVEGEVMPTIDMEAAHLAAYAAEVSERFRNPYIKHRLASIALNSLSKWETRIYPTLADSYRLTGKVAPHLAFSFAALLALYAPGSGFTPEDNPQHVAAIAEAWGAADAEATVSAVLSAGIFSHDIEAEVPGFTKLVAEYVSKIRTNGLAACL